MSLFDKYHLRNYPIEILFKKVFSRGKYVLFSKKRKRWKYGKNEHRKEVEGVPFNSFFNIQDLTDCNVDEKVSKFLLNAFLEHRFDLLGSGWVNWSYGNEAYGMEGQKYAGENIVPDKDGQWLREVVPIDHFDRSMEIWSYVDQNYEPIDWQRDMKSGFRWSAKKWSGDQASLNKGKAGADPKVPLELGRLQHLPRMAILAFHDPERIKYVREFRNQILDFIATNPPGMGINWHYSMDVGIRVANMLVAFDLFVQLDKENILDSSFKKEFLGSIEQHADYIEKNPEFQDGLTGNHYLFNLTGLIFSGAYLPKHSNGRNWLLTGWRGMIRELFKQFLPDGGNFEGSTAYHRLGTEMMVWCFALINASERELKRVGLPDRIQLSKWSQSIADRSLSIPKGGIFPEEFQERFFNVCLGALSLTKPNGEHPQIGDNDSGRLFRLTPVGKIRNRQELSSIYSGALSEQDEVFDENMLEQLTLNAAIHGCWKLEEDERGSWFEYRMVKKLLSEPRKPRRKIKAERLPGTIKIPSDLNYSAKEEIPLGKERSYEWVFFPHTGWFLLKGEDLFMIINAPEGSSLRHTWGHVHNDRLSFELYLDGKDKVVDPGSYIYGALPGKRNLFRSNMVHSIPHVNGEEQNGFSAGGSGLFFLDPDSKCKVLGFENGHLQLELKFRGIHQIREFILNGNNLEIRDHSSHSFNMIFNRGETHSRGYGKLLRPF